MAAAVGVLLLAFSGRYGYHRDELYFLEAGRHLAWGYPDQPPLTPLLARLMDLLVPGSVAALRLPSTLSAAAVAFLAGLIAHDLGARRAGQIVAAVATGLTGFVLGTGHLLSTATSSLLGWTVCTFLLVRLLTGRAGLRGWILLGLVAGVTAQANVLVLFLVAALGVAVLLVGPRSLLRTRGPYVAIAILLAIVAPYLLWQADHGWPQAEIGRDIAEGGSGTSEARWAFLPLQLVQVGPWLAPIWLTGLVRLWRTRPLRVLAAAYLVLTVVFIVLGGKPYYLAGLYPVLLAAGAQPVVDRARRWMVPAMLVASLPVLAFVLPVLPARQAGAVIAVNYDAGETIGWPAYVERIATAYRTMPAGTVILAGNYGEAGAVDRYGPGLGLPPAYSGHNGYGAWGPPPGEPESVLAVGIDRARLGELFTDVRPLGRLRSSVGVENDEDGARIYACTGPRLAWDRLWPRIVHLG